MKRVVLLSGSLVALCLIVVLRADVKTTEKSSAKFEGFIGMLMRFAGGSEPTTSSLALKGNRMSQMNGSTGMIVDLGEQKIYQLDTKKKEYTMITFADMRAQMEKAKADAEKQMAQMKPEDKQAMQDAKDATKNIEFDADVKETGQKKPILGYDTREVILTITMHEKGKKIEDSGGIVMSNDMWLAPRIPALAELGDFYTKFFQTVYGGVFTGADPRSMAQVSAMVPGFLGASEKLSAESKKLAGTAIVTTTKLETVKSAEQMKQVSQQSQQSGGGGLSGALARRMMGNRGGNPADPRSTLMTITREYLTIATTASAEDVAIPQGFKEKKQ